MREPDPQQVSTWKLLKKDQPKEHQKVLRALSDSHPQSARYRKYSAYWLGLLMKPKPNSGIPLWRGQVWKHLSSEMQLFAFLRHTGSNNKFFCVTGSSPNRGVARAANDPQDDLDDLNELCCELRAQGTQQLEILYPVEQELFYIQYNQYQFECATDDADLQEIWKLAAINELTSTVPYIKYEGTTAVDSGMPNHEPWLGESVHRWTIHPDCS